MTLAGVWTTTGEHARSATKRMAASPSARVTGAFVKNTEPVGASARTCFHLGVSNRRRPETPLQRIGFRLVPRCQTLPSSTATGRRPCPLHIKPADVLARERRWLRREVWAALCTIVEGACQVLVQTNLCSAVPSYRSNRRSRSSQAAWEARKRCPCRAHRDCPLTPIPKWLGGARAGSSTDSRSNGWPKIIHRLPGTDFGTTDKSSVPVPVQTTLLLQ